MKTNEKSVAAPSIPLKNSFHIPHNKAFESDVGSDEGRRSFDEESSHLHPPLPTNNKASIAFASRSFIGGN